MAAGERKQIEGLPQGWVWEYGSGEYSEQSSGSKTGRILKGRHAVNYLSGDTLTVKSVRDIQRGQKGLATTPKSQGKSRSGVIYTKTQESERRGMTARWSFRTLEEAQQFVINGGIPKNYVAATIQTKFSSSRKEAKGYGKKGHRYATLSPFLFRSAWKKQVRWDEAFDKATEFNYDKNSRFYVYAVER